MTCHVFGQTHCVKAIRLKEGPWQSNVVKRTVTCHVFGQTHCVNANKSKEMKRKQRSQIERGLGKVMQ